MLISYDCGYQIHYLAPTGRVAKMIGGMTIHKGLGIAIKQVIKGKGNWKLEDNCEDYTILITPTKVHTTWDEWKLVDILFLDEIATIWIT